MYIFAYYKYKLYYYQLSYDIDEMVFNTLPCNKQFDNRYLDY